jgi:hypothetical protein
VISVEGGVDTAMADKLIEIAGKCPVHRTLEARTAVVTKVAPSPLFSRNLSHRGSESAKAVVRQWLGARGRGSPMATECRQDSFGTVEGRAVMGAFDGG